MFDNPINDPGVMADGAKRKPISARLWLTVVALCQVFLTPLAAFALTYLIKFDVFGENITISFQKRNDSLDWDGITYLWNDGFVLGTVAWWIHAN